MDIAEPVEKIYRIRSVCYTGTCSLSDYETSAGKVPSVDRTEKTRANNQMRVIYCIHHGVKTDSRETYGAGVR